MEVTGRELLLWDGACMVHEAFSMEKLYQAMVNEKPEIILDPLILKKALKPI